MWYLSNKSLRDEFEKNTRKNTNENVINEEKIDIDNGKTLFLLCNRVYTIGRRMVNSSVSASDLELIGDSSISRKHAEIVIKFNETQCSDLLATPSIILTDHSK